MIPYAPQFAVRPTSTFSCAFGTFSGSAGPHAAPTRMAPASAVPRHGVPGTQGRMPYAEHNLVGSTQTYCQHTVYMLN